MNVAVLLVLSLAALVILEFIWMPQLKKQLGRSRSKEMIGLSAMQAALGYVRGVLLVTVLTSSAILVLLFWLENVGIDVAAAEASLLKVQSWRGRLAGLGWFWGGLTLVVLAVGLYVHAYFRGRRRMERVFDQVHKIRERRREELRQAGLLDPNRTRLEQRRQKLLAYRLSLRDKKPKAPAPPLIDPDLPGMEEVLRKCNVLTAGPLVLKVIEKLDEGIAACDERTLGPLVIDPEAVALPKPRNLWERFQMVFISQGLHASLGGGSRLLHAAGMVLLVPSLLGVTSGNTGRVLDRIERPLTEIILKASQADAERSYKAAKKSLPKARQALTPKEDKAVQRLAVRFEQAVASNALWNDASESQDNSYRERLDAEIKRQEKQRIELLTDTTPIGLNPWDAKARILAMPSDADRAITKVLMEVQEGKPVSTFGARANQELKDAAERSPTVRERIRSTAVPFQTPVDGRSLRLSMKAHLLGLLIDGGQSPLSQFVQSTIDARAWSTSGTLRDQAFQRFYSDLVAEGRDVSTSLDRVRQANFGRPVEIGVVLTEMKNSLRVVTDGLEELSPLEKVKDPEGWAHKDEKNIQATLEEDFKAIKEQEIGEKLSKEAKEEMHGIP